MYTHQYDRISTLGLAFVPHKSYQFNKPNRTNDSEYVTNHDSQLQNHDL